MNQVTIFANDETFTVPEGCRLDAFLCERGYTVGQVVVERNGHALSPSEVSSVRLAAGDRLEIVCIVAGG